MKVNELMIGDLVMYRGEPIIVYEIDDYYDRINTEPDGYNSIRCIELSELQPIPLTAQILEKNGFELYEQDFTSNKVYVFDKGFTYIEDCGNYFVIGAKVEYEHFGRKLRFISSTIKVYYVHELQHALRLAGIDKTIEL